MNYDSRVIIEEECPFDLRVAKVLVTCYSFKRFPELVADKFGNFYSTHYFPLRPLNKRNNGIYHKGRVISFNTLRKEAFKQIQKHGIHKSRF